MDPRGEELARLRSKCHVDVVDDLRYARANNPLFNQEMRECKRLLEKNNEMDESCRKFLSCLLNTAEMFEPQKEVQDKANDEVGSDPKIYGVNDVGQESEGGSGSKVEILDSEATIKEGNLGTFGPSKRHHESMEDSFLNLLRSSEGGEFRKQVLNVLRKPFDEEEYVRHQEGVKCYLDHYPDLRKKLTKYRYDQRKCLTIYRGFFFWLQNLAQQGSFKPWEDRECLAVVPGST